MAACMHVKSLVRKVVLKLYTCPMEKTSLECFWEFRGSYNVQDIFLVFCRTVLHVLVTYHPKDPDTVFSSRVVDRQRTPFCLLFWPNVAPRFPSVVF